MYPLKYFNINNYTETQIETARAATLEDAITLWNASDWETYKSMQETLLALLQAHRRDEVSISAFQFMHFINSHLRERLPDGYPDRRLFLAKLPTDKPAGDAAWQRISDPAFWEQVL